MRRTQGGKPKRVEIQIDELVLHGFGAGERFAIAEAVQQELARRFSERGLPDALAAPLAIERLDAGAFQAMPGARATSTGANVARAIYEGLGPEPKPRRTALRTPGERGPRT